MFSFEHGNKSGQFLGAAKEAGAVIVDGSDRCGIREFDPDFGFDQINAAGVVSIVVQADIAVASAERPVERWIGRPDRADIRGGVVITAASDRVLSGSSAVDAFPA
ncbi:MAG: hypothetical protein ABSB74_15890 [Tepidisphaeraceae bacterium]